MFRFSLRTLVVIATLMIFGLAAAVANNLIAARMAYTVNWILLCLSLVAAFATVDERRRFWIGFAVFAWCYWLLMGDSSPNRVANWARARSGVSSWGSTDTPPASGESLITDDIISFIEKHAHAGWSLGDAVMAQYSGGSYYPGVIDDINGGQYLIRWTDGSSSPAQWTLPAQIMPGTNSSRVAAHCLMCSLWGVLGGFLATTITRRRTLPVAVQPPAPAPEKSAEEPKTAGKNGDNGLRKASEPIVEAPPA
jgi:hypothetical protein